MQDAEALGGSGQGYIQVGRAPRALREDPFRFHDQNGVEFQAFCLRRRHRARYTGWTDDNTGSLTAGFFVYEFLYGRIQFAALDSL